MMVKKVVTDRINTDWQEAFQDKSKEYVIEWINAHVPDGYILGYDYGHECSTYGHLEYTRLETDEEEQAREVKEAVIAAKRAEELAKRENIRLLVERANSKSELDIIVINAYRGKHKDNPKLESMVALLGEIIRNEKSGSTTSLSMARGILEGLESGEV